MKNFPTTVNAGKKRKEKEMTLLSMKVEKFGVGRAGSDGTAK